MTAMPRHGLPTGLRHVAAPGPFPGPDGSGHGDAAWRRLLRTAGPRLPEVLLRALTQLGDAVFITDTSGAITWANEAFTRFTGCTGAQAAGRQRLDLSRGPVTPQQQQLAEDLAALRAVSAEFPTRDGAGSRRWVALSAFPVLDDDGRATGLIGIERDVTAHREALDRRHQALRRAESLAVALEHEKRLLSMVIDTIPHVVWWKGSDLRFTGCNAAYLRLRGLHDRLELLGRLEGQLGLDDAVGPRLTELERAVLETGRPLLDVNVVLEDPPGTTLQISVQPYLDNGELAGVVGVGADISHATELERQLAQANRLESIGQLAAGIAHEINTPVQYASDNTRFVAESVSGVFTALRRLRELADGAGTVDGAATAEPADGAGSTAPADRPGPASVAVLRERLREILADLDLDFVAEEVPSALVQSLEGLDRVTQIVRAMKDFSHPGQGRSRADVNQLVTSTVQVSRNEWKYVARLDLDLDPEVGLVSCYPGDLKQVVLNIIVNAAQAVDERRRLQHEENLGSILVATRRVGDEVRITVTDDGIGMDEETARRVFDPFFTTKDVGKGTGQGLSLARTAMKKHDGRIEVSSRPGEGATFSIVLPVRAPEAPDPPPGPQLTGTGRTGQAATDAGAERGGWR